jgi:hypothetical protein
MSAPSHWTFGASTLRRIVEFEGPILSPFEIFGDCTQAHLDENRSWLVPRFQDAASGILIITIQSFFDPTERSHCSGRRLRRQRQRACASTLSPP